jgi:hypothetical protein
LSVKIIDSIMGSGKTEWAIGYMNAHPEKKFMYITPYNDELKDRIIPKCPSLKFRFAKEGRKVHDFKQMLANGENIAATHECFKRADEEVEALLEANDYTLILDEVFDVVIDLKYSKADIQGILSYYATVDEHNRLVWTSEEYQDENAKYGDIIKLAKLGKILVFDNSLFLWLFPIEFFHKFSEVYVMTYLFPGQIQKYYFDMHGVGYEYYKVIGNQQEGYKLIGHDGTISNDLKSLVSVYEGNLNTIGRKSALSSTWYDNAGCKLNVLRKNIRCFLREKHHAKAKDIMWTCFEGAKDSKTGKYKFIEQLKGEGYTSGFVPCNCRATNVYKERTYAAYCVNRYMRPMIKRYVGMTDAQQEIWALSEMLQFLWRSAIREGHKINLYIPSERMRRLLYQFLDNEIQLDYIAGQ